ncbi:Defensin-like protein 6 [Linum perenne]
MAKLHYNTLPRFILMLMLLIFMSSYENIGMVKVAEARVCASQSHYFKGPCGRDHNCAMVCRNEGFSGGRCKGFRRRCFCTRLC